MNSWLYVYAFNFAAAFLLTLAATPLCKILARKTGFLDVPKSEKHKMHGKATPLLGGLAMGVAWLLTVMGGFAVVFLFSIPVLKSTSGALLSKLPEILVISGGAAASMILGMIDDKHPMKAHTKFLGQLVIALCVVLFGGIRISMFLSSTWLSCAVTVFWFLFMFNAFNFFDNMDGLAVGTAAIAFFFFTIAAIAGEQYFVANLCACSAAVACGFWIFNASPASIFMGDAGSHFLAFLLSVVSAKVTFYNPDVASTRFAVLIPFFILAVPIFDTFAVVAIRLRNHKPVYVGDNNHISHRFYRMGMTRARAVQMVHLLVLIFALGALPLLWGDLRTCIVLLVQGGVLFLLLSLMQYAAIHSRTTDAPK